MIHFQAEEGILEEEPEEILAKIDSLGENEVVLLYDRFCGANERSDDQGDIRATLSQELTRLTTDLKLESQELLASEPNGEESEGLSDARNADEEQSDTESEVPSAQGSHFLYRLNIIKCTTNFLVLKSS